MSTVQLNGPASEVELDKIDVQLDRTNVRHRSRHFVGDTPLPSLIRHPVGSRAQAWEKRYKSPALPLPVARSLFLLDRVDSTLMPLLHMGYHASATQCSITLQHTAYRNDRAHSSTQADIATAATVSEHTPAAIYQH